jgi:hypothetical protein
VSLERTTRGASLIELLERVLDKDIVIDASARSPQVGIEVMTDEARIATDSVQTYLDEPPQTG